jgi:hypothetical protein
MQTASGYSASFTRVDEKTIREHDRLTLEGLQCLLEQTGFTEPLFVATSLGAASSGKGSGAAFPFLSRDQAEAVEVERVQGFSSGAAAGAGDSATAGAGAERRFHQQVFRRVAGYLGMDPRDFRHIDTCASSQSPQSFFLQGARDKAVPPPPRPEGQGQERRVHRPLPVYAATALQIGLLNNPHVPR